SSPRVSPPVSFDWPWASRESTTSWPTSSRVSRRPSETGEAALSVSIDLNATASDQPDWESLPDGKLVGMKIGSLPLDSGEWLDDVTLAFQRWGTLSPSRDNVI